MQASRKLALMQPAFTAGHHKLQNHPRRCRADHEDAVLETNCIERDLLERCACSRRIGGDGKGCHAQLTVPEIFSSRFDLRCMSQIEEAQWRRSQLASTAFQETRKLWLFGKALCVVGW